MKLESFSSFNYVLFVLVFGVELETVNVDSVFLHF